MSENLFLQEQSFLLVHYQQRTRIRMSDYYQKNLQPQLLEHLLDLQA